MPEGVVTRTWAHPRSVADFACQWRSEVLAARRLGHRVGPGRYAEIRYERLVEDPERELRSVCAFAGIELEPGMLEYADEVDVSSKPHQQSLRRPPTPGLRDWRSQMAAEDVRAFDEVAGDLLRELGYGASTEPSARGRVRRLGYAARIRAWNLAGSATRRSPLWRRRHPVLAS
jgi:Sulfotransferase family